jgi:pimeloyl-ACP methyl ester carboxylesterase
MAALQRAYANVQLAGQAVQIHYRSAGSGPTVVLLHPSPLNSSFQLPLLEHLVAAGFTVIAWDAPGYGQSDPLPSDAPGLAPYAEALSAFLDALQLAQPLLYGNATGAQIALELARRERERAALLVLDNVAVFSEQEREDLLAAYFPDLAPQADGSHLLRLWHMAAASTQYFPWYRQDAGHCFNPRPPDPAATQQAALAFQLAGPDYDRAYRAAFASERVEAFHGLATPTRIICWQDSPLRPFSDRLGDIELPACVELRHAGPGIAARFDGITAALRETPSST